MQALRLPTVSARPAARPLRAPAPPRASAIAEPATLPIKGADGSDQGTAELALKVASPQTARHVVHRYMVQINQNARQVCAAAYQALCCRVCCGPGGLFRHPCLSWAKQASTPGPGPEGMSRCV